MTCGQNLEPQGFTVPFLQILGSKMEITRKPIAVLSSAMIARNWKCWRKDERYNGAVEKNRCARGVPQQFSLARF
jgi:hypothetical protein